MKRKYNINTGTLQARGLFNITPKDENDKRISLWFDLDTKKMLEKLTAKHFNAKCEEMLNNVPA